MEILKAGRFAKDDAGDTVITSIDQLVDAAVDWFGFGDMGSPYPSGEDPREATHKWYDGYLRLTVRGPNVFQWTCSGCGSRLEVETNYLHTCPLFDYVFWEFCPTCRQALRGDSA